MKKIIMLVFLLLFSIQAQAGLTLVSQPRDTILRVGESTTFTMGATSNRSLRYYWYKNGTMLSNKTKSITIKAGAEGETTYTCLVTDGKDKARCQPFTLFVVKGGVIQFSWNKPTTRADGTTLKPEEIQKYRLYKLDPVTKQMVFLTDIGGFQETQAVYNFPPGSYTFKMSTVDTNNLEGAMSDSIIQEVK